jgi:hypothetical protein
MYMYINLQVLRNLHNYLKEVEAKLKTADTSSTSERLLFGGGGGVLVFVESQRSRGGLKIVFKFCGSNPA